MEQLTTIIEKNAAEEIQIALTMWKSRQLVDVRIFAADRATGVRVPTKKGLSVKPALLTPLVEALRIAEAELAKKLPTT